MSARGSLYPLSIFLSFSNLSSHLAPHFFSSLPPVPPNEHWSFTLHLFSLLSSLVLTTATDQLLIGHLPLSQRQFILLSPV